MNESSNLSEYANLTNGEPGIQMFRDFILGWNIFDAILIIATNSLTMIILCIYAKLETPSNVFIAWLTLSDLCFAARVPFDILLMYFSEGLGWTTACILKLYIGASASISNGLALCVISIDRLMYMVYSLEYHTIMTVRKVRATVSSLVVFSVLLPLLCYLFGYQGRYTDGKCETHIGMHVLAGAILSLPIFIVMPITIGCYIKIGLVALAQKRAISAAASGPVPPTETGTDYKITKVMLNVLVIYIGCNFMLFLVSLLSAFLSGFQKEIMYGVVIGFWRVNKWVNPVIYVWKSKRFRKHIQRFLKNTPFASNSAVF